MEPFDECSVLLPSATLEDFPNGGAESDARSLLAGWTVLWHPLLLSATQQLPTWYRADAPPTPDGPRVIVVPEPARLQLPDDFRAKCDANPNCQWVTGADRGEMLRSLGVLENDVHSQVLEHEGRPLQVDDFFAVGYLMLQIQIMTRRLRYTSNLDELYLQSRVVSAAEAFCQGDGAGTADALHDVFDALSEERDHYFSSDPHLIDLTLLTPELLQIALQSGWLERLAGGGDQTGGAGQGSSTTIPRNVLVDGTLAETLAGEGRGRWQSPELLERFKTLLRDGQVGWAGGGSGAATGGAGAGPNHGSDDENLERENLERENLERGDLERGGLERAAATAGAAVRGSCLDAMTMAEARQAFAEGTALAETAVGVRPRVYARLSGMTPADMVPTLAGLGYQGLIPIDFAHGAGYGEESKVILASGGSELEALTAKPIDAASEVAFQSLGARLGEAIDAGEVATGLLVHWPDRVCDSFGDLCRVATWCVALGKFWTLPEYFSDGERPYHHGSLESVGKRSADALLADLAGAPQGATLAEVAASFCRRVRRETERVTAVIAMLAKPQLVDQSQLDWETPGAGGSESPSMAERLLCEAVGVQPCQPQRPASDALCFNPHGAPARSEARLAGGAPPEESFVYGASQDGNGCAEVTCDVPATGFTRLGATARLPKQGLLKRMVGGGKGIAEPSILRNQFMAVSLNDETGGISGVFSASRGNRLSLRLVAGSELSGDSEGGTMVSEHVETLHSDAALGELRSSGQLRRGDGQPIAEFSLRYRLRRGSRALEIEGTIRPQLQQVRSDSDAWKRALALRVAVAEEAAIMRPLVRDKVQSSAARKLVAPLGVLIDEADKQTLVCGHGLPLHRKVGDRFLDTLVGIVPAAGDGAGQGGAFEFRTTLAFDCPAPVAFARSLVVPLRSLPIEPSGQATSRNGQAWLMHVSAPETLVTDMRVARRRDGKLAARMQVVQTRAKTSRVKLQFCAFAHAAFLADDAGIERSLDELPENVRCNDGVVELTLGNHEAVDLVVVFDV